MSKRGMLLQRALYVRGQVSFIHRESEKESSRKLR
jgi:hypothetical protein